VIVIGGVALPALTARSTVLLAAQLALDHLKCFVIDGEDAAPLLYRLDGVPVSLFIIPGLGRPATELSLLDHDEAVWNDGQRTYVLVARSGAHDRLQHVASGMRNEAK